MLTAELAHQTWRYDPETGEFSYKISPRYGIEIGDKAGWFDGLYNRLTFKGKQYKCSRVAWLMTKGEWPTNWIDHRNGEKSDDRFSNLRQATPSQNAKNARLRSSNRLGVKGVTKAQGKRRGYVSVIMSEGNQKYLGYFPTVGTAKAAYDAAAATIHGEFARP